MKFVAVWLVVAGSASYPDGLQFIAYPPSMEMCQRIARSSQVGATCRAATISLSRSQEGGVGQRYTGVWLVTMSAKGPGPVSFVRLSSLKDCRASLEMVKKEDPEDSYACQEGVLYVEQ